MLVTIMLFFICKAFADDPRNHTKEQILQFLMTEKMDAHWEKHYKEWLKNKVRIILTPNKEEN